MHIDTDIKEKVTHFLEEAPENMGTALGITFTSFKRDQIKASMPANRNTIQPFGVLHGGASVALAETLASMGAWLNINEQYQMVVGIEINANHVRSVPKGGTVFGTAIPVHQGKKIQVWEINIHNEDEKLICTSRCTLAVIDKK